MAMCFVLAGGFSDSATAVQLLLSSKTLQNISGGTSITSQDFYKSFDSCINGMTSLIAVDNAMYSASHVDKAISVCNLLRQNIGTPVHVITKPVRDNALSAFKGSSRFQPSAKSVST